MASERECSHPRSHPRNNARLSSLFSSKQSRRDQEVCIVCTAANTPGRRGPRKPSLRRPCKATVLARPTTLPGQGFRLTVTCRQQEACGANQRRPLEHYKALPLGAVHYTLEFPPSPAELNLWADAIPQFSFIIVSFMKLPKGSM